MPQITEQLREEVFRKKGRRCRYCGKLAHAVDHYFPAKYGGATNLLNLEPVCEKCNRLKGDTVPHPDPNHPAHLWWLRNHPMNERCRNYYKKG